MIGLFLDAFDADEEAEAKGVTFCATDATATFSLSTVNEGEASWTLLTTNSSITTLGPFSFYPFLENFLKVSNIKFNQKDGPK